MKIFRRKKPQMSPVEKLIHKGDKNVERYKRRGIFKFLFVLNRSNKCLIEAKLLYVRAGNEAKSELNYQLAIKAYTKAVEICEVDSAETGECYEKIASCYLTYEPRQAIAYYKQASQIYASSGRYSTAGTLLEKCIQLCEQIDDYDIALDLCLIAERYYMEGNEKAFAFRIKSKIAGIYVVQHKYTDAKNLFENLVILSKQESTISIGFTDERHHCL
ncbi:unnamed protein product, partial [Didymodactylos carnosus]